MEEIKNEVVETENTEVQNSASKADIATAAGLVAFAGYGVYSLGKNVVNKVRAKKGKDPVGITSLFKRKKKEPKVEVKATEDPKVPEKKNSK